MNERPIGAAPINPAPPAEEITADLWKAFAIEAAAREAPILAWADGRIQTFGESLGDALASGFKQKVPLAGGSIGAAVKVAIAQLETEGETDLKAAFDKLVALAQARGIPAEPKATAPPEPEPEPAEPEA